MIYHYDFGEALHLLKSLAVTDIQIMYTRRYDRFPMEELEDKMTFVFREKRRIDKFGDNRGHYTFGVQLTEELINYMCGFLDGDCALFSFLMESSILAPDGSIHNLTFEDEEKYYRNEDVHKRAKDTFNLFKDCVFYPKRWHKHAVNLMFNEHRTLVERLYKVIDPKDELDYLVDLTLISNGQYRIIQREVELSKSKIATEKAHQIIESYEDNFNFLDTKYNIDKEN